MIDRWFGFFVVSISVPIAVLCSSIVLAQGGAIEEVEVIAERSTENDTLELSSSVKVFDLEDIENNQIAGFEDISNFVPGLTASPTGSQGLRFTLRGVGARDDQLGVETRVGLYIDGAFLGRASGSFDLVDLENIIVNKGPVGTRGGRNAVGGSINLITARPDLERFESRLKFGAGNFGARTVSGIINMPVTDTVGVRAGYAKAVRDGWVVNEGVGEDFWGYDRDSFRLSLAWQANENIRVDYSFDINAAVNQPGFNQPIPDTNGGALGPYTRVIALPGPDIPAAVEGPFFTSRSNRVNSVSNIENGTTDTSGHTLNVVWDWSQEHNLELNATYRDAEVLNTFYFYPDVDKDTLAATAIRLPFANAFNFINQQVAGFSQFPEYTRFCCSQPLAAFGNAANTASVTSFLESPRGGDLALRDHEQFSVEFKLSGSFADGQVEYVGGLYYFNERTGNGQQLPGIPYDDIVDDIDFASQHLDNNLFYFSALEILGIVDTSGLTSNASAISYFNLNNINTDAPAIFTEWTYNPYELSWLHLTLGARYTYEEKTLKRTPLRAFTLDRLDDDLLEEKNKWESFDPAVKLRFDLSESSHIYFSYAEAFRAGNFNVLTRRVDDLGFEAENIKTYEIGLKGSIFDQLIDVELSVFASQLENGQSTIQNQFSPLQRSIVNADGTSEGLEISFRTHLSEAMKLGVEYTFLRSGNDPIDNPFTGDYLDAIQNVSGGLPGFESVDLPLDPNQSVNEASVIAELEALCFLDLDNEPIEGTSRKVDLDRGTCTTTLSNFGSPVHSVLVSLDYSIPKQWGEIAVHLGYSYTEEFFVGDAVTNTSRDLFDLRISTLMELNSGTVKLALWSQNLFDNEYTVNTQDISILATDTALFGTPRTFGLDIEFNWL